MGTSCKFGLGFFAVGLMVLLLAGAFTGVSGNVATAQEGLEREATLLEYSGDVVFKRDGGEKEISAFEGMTFTRGDQIITGRDSWTEIEVEDKAEIRLSENSKVYINELIEYTEEEVEESSFSLFSGGFFGDVKDTLTTGSRFEVETDTAVMGVRGTDYYVSKDNDRTSVSVISGSISVEPREEVVEAPEPAEDPADPEDPEAPEEAEETLEPGEEFELEAGETASLEETPDGRVETETDDTTHEDLDLEALERLQEMAEEDPDRVPEELQEGLDDAIEESRQEREARQEEAEEEVEAEPQVEPAEEVADEEEEPEPEDDPDEEPEEDPDEDPDEDEDEEETDPSPSPSPSPSPDPDPEPAYFAVDIIEIEEVEAGETMQIEVEVENEGEETDTQTIELQGFDEDVVDENEALELEGGEEESFELAWETEENEADTDDITVASEDEETTEEVTIGEDTLDPETGNIEGTVELDENTVDQDVDVEVTANGEDTTVTIEDGESSEAYKIEELELGDYEVSAEVTGDAEGDYEVVTEEQEDVTVGEGEASENVDFTISKIVEQGTLTVEDFSDKFSDEEEGYDYGDVTITVNEEDDVNLDGEEVTLLIEDSDDNEEFSETIDNQDIPAEGDKEFEFSVGEIDDADGYTATVTVDADNAEEVTKTEGFEVTEDVDQADFTVNIDEVQTDDTVKQGKKVTVIADIENTGEAESTQDITLDFGDEEEIDSESVTLGDEESEEVTLNYDVASDAELRETTATVNSEDDEDSYNIEVNDPESVEPETFTVTFEKDNDEDAKVNVAVYEDDDFTNENEVVDVIIDNGEKEDLEEGEYWLKISNDNYKYHYEYNLEISDDKTVELSFENLEEDDNRPTKVYAGQPIEAEDIDGKGAYNHYKIMNVDLSNDIDIELDDVNGDLIIENATMEDGSGIKINPDNGDFIDIDIDDDDVDGEVILDFKLKGINDGDDKDIDIEIEKDVADVELKIEFGDIDDNNTLDIEDYVDDDKVDIDEIDDDKVPDGISEIEIEIGDD